MHSRYILKSITFKNIFQLYTCNYYPHINHCFDIFCNPFAMFIPWIKATIHAESVRLFSCIQLTNWLVKSRVQDNKYRKIKKKKKRKLVYLPRRYLDLVTTKSWYLTSGIQLRFAVLLISSPGWMQRVHIWYWGYDTGCWNAGISQTGFR